MTSEPLPPGFEELPEQHSARPRRVRLLGSVAAALILIGGGVGSYFAFASSNAGGASSPTAAVQNVVADLQKSDLVGLLDDLAPGERDALSGAVRADVNSLKRLGVLSGDANASAIPGVHFSANNFTYGQPVVINDHVQVVPITSGSVDVSADASRLFTQELLGQLTGQRTASQHIPITQPVRIAAQKVDGGWYASIFYTVADAAAHHVVPSAAQAIPAEGATTPEGAVANLIDAAVRGDVHGMIQVVSPDELGALHDYGGLIRDANPMMPRAGALHPAIKTLHLSSQPISGGVRVTLDRLVVSVAGQEFSISRQPNNCFALDLGGRTQTFCAQDAEKAIERFSPSVTCAASSDRSVAPFCRREAVHLTAGQRQAVTHLLDGLFGLGVVTTESGGSWYVAPVRTFADWSSTVLDHLQGDDLFQLSTIGH